MFGKKVVVLVSSDFLARLGKSSTDDNETQLSLNSTTEILDILRLAMQPNINHEILFSKFISSEIEGNMFLRNAFHYATEIKIVVSGHSAGVKIRCVLKRGDIKLYEICDIYDGSGGSVDRNTTDYVMGVIN